MIVAAQPAGGRRWREADNDTVSNDGDRDQKESEVTVLLYYLFSFPLSFFYPLFLSLWFQKQSPRPRFFFSIRPLSAPFLYFVSLSKLLSTSPKSPLFLFCFTLFFVSFFEILPPLYFWFSPCIYRKQGRGPPYPVQAQGKVAWGGFCIAALERGSLSFLYHVGRVLWVYMVSSLGRE
jgi:hypothetical protein